MTLNTPPVNAPKYARLLDRLLDEGYFEETGPVIRAISKSSDSGPLATRLRQFDDRASELVEAGQPMTVSDPMLRALLADFDDTLARAAQRIDGVSASVEAQGAGAAGEFVKLTSVGTDAVGLSIGWNTPDPAAVARAVNYTSSAEWAAALERYQTGIARQVQMIALQGMIDGRGPLTIAREVRRAVESIPTAAANNLLRTLQLTSYRDAVAVHQVANSEILSYQVRIASLDSRCCMACVSLHGTRLALGERVDDHHMGRCTSIAVVRGRPDPGIQTGAEWFNQRSAAQQGEQMGHAAYEAWRAGEIQLSDFVHFHHDPLWGEMLQEASLKGILGEAAKQYYKTR